MINEKDKETLMEKLFFPSRPQSLLCSSHRSFIYIQAQYQQMHETLLTCLSPFLIYRQP